MKNGYGIVLFPINYKDPVEAALNRLRDPQKDALPKVIRSLKNGRNVLLVQPPGAGKTKEAMIIAEFLRSMKSFHKLIIIATPTLGINENFLSETYSVYDSKYKINPDSFIGVHDRDVGKIRYLYDAIKSYEGDKEKAYICSYATLVRVYTLIKDLNMLNKLCVIFDEGHHAGVHESHTYCNRIGLFIKDLVAHGGRYIITTATDFRSDGCSIMPESNNCDKYIFTYYDFLHGYKTPYVSNQSISMICYDFASPEDVNYVSEKESDENRFCTNFDKYVEALIKQYRLNPVKTLIIAPDTIIRGNMSWAEVCIRIEEVFIKAFPNIRVCNVGGCYVNGEPTLVSSVRSSARNIYKSLQKNPDDYDLVISIRVMDEGIDWSVCKQTLICGITKNMRQFIQRDIGRGARMKIDSNNHDLCYFVAGINNDENSKEYKKALETVRKHFVHFQTLIVMNGIYVDFIKRYNVNIPNSFCSSDKSKSKNIPQEVREEFVDKLESKKMEKEEWSAKDTLKLIMGSPELVNYAHEAKLELFMNLHKDEAMEVVEAVKKTNKVCRAKAKVSANYNKSFDIWFEIFEKEIGNIKFKVDTFDGLRKFGFVATKRVTMEDVKDLFIFNEERLTREEVEELKRMIMS